MKRKLLFVSLSLGIVLFLRIYGHAVSNQIYTDYGTYYEVRTASNSAVTVSSSAVTTSSAVDEGVQRIFTNVGSTNIWECKDSTGVVDGDTVAERGQPLQPYAPYLEDRYFGDIYFQTTAGDSSNELRIEIIRQSTY